MEKSKRTFLKQAAYVITLEGNGKTQYIAVDLR